MDLFKLENPKLMEYLTDDWRTTGTIRYLMERSGETVTDGLLSDLLRLKTEGVVESQYKRYPTPDEIRRYSGAPLQFRLTELGKAAKKNA